MPQTRACDFCGDDIEPGTGTMYVTVDGSVTHFCSSKCEKNADLDREPRNLEWTEQGGTPGGEEAMAESTQSEPAEASESNTAADREVPPSEDETATGDTVDRSDEEAAPGAADGDEPAEGDNGDEGEADA